VNIWLIIVLAGMLTFLTRLSFIWLFNHMTLPWQLRKALKYVPPAVLAVIIFQEILIRDGNFAITSGNTRLLAGVIAIVTAWRTRSTLLTIGIGMTALVILNYFL